MNQKIIDIQMQIDSIKEYLDTELCKKCQDMKIQLEKLNDLVSELIKQDAS